MGAIFSTLILLAGSIAVGVLAAIAARAAATKNWPKAKLYAGITAAVAGTLVLACLGFIIKSKMGAGAATGAISDAAPGFNISLILMIITMVGVSVLSVFAAINAGSSSGQKTRKSEEFSAISAALAFVGFLISIIVIVILL